MYRVLIVDDEEPARETLKYIIDWEQTAFRIEGVAKNGREALALYEKIKPDLVITDIQMPVMNGLVLIKEIKKICKHQKFVILSCHEDFNYAKEAIRSGVSDYLLKDLLTPQDLYSLLEKIRLELEDSQLSRQPQYFSKEEYVQEWKQAFLKKLVLEEETEAILEEYKGLMGESFIMMSIAIDDYYDIYMQKKSTMMLLRNKIMDRINQCVCESSWGECFYDEKGSFIAISGIERTKSEYTFIKNCYHIANKIHKTLKEIEIRVTIGVSSVFANLSLAKAKYEEAKSVVQYRVFLGKGKTILYNIQFVKSGSLNMDLIEKHLQDIRHHLDKKDFEAVKRQIIQIYCKDITGFIQYNYLKYINSRLLGLILEYCTKANISLESVFGCRYLPVEKLDAFDTLEDMTNWFMELFNTIADIKCKTKTAYNKHVQDAINYIDKNSKKKINLTHISQELSLNKAYLCRIFKNETGDTLTDYINQVRISDAKALIQTTQYKMYEIAEYVGFTNIQHFNSTFKKITGENPMFFR